jgi:hypothetical protein
MKLEGLAKQPHTPHGATVDASAKECFATAAALLQQATGCQPSVAAMIVNQIALGTIRWGEPLPASRALRNRELFDAWQAGFSEGQKA